MPTASSGDGTTIAYDRDGAGDPLVLVPGAFSYRRYPGLVKLAGLRAARFTVCSYDRRGRGDSGGTPAVCRRARDRGSRRGDRRGRRARARLGPFPSGAVLALAAAGLPGRRLAVHEPPFVVGPAGRRPPAGLLRRVTAPADAGQRGAAVRYFMLDGMGAPAFPAMPRLMPKAWRARTAVAHTLPYDAAIMRGYQDRRPLPAGQRAPVAMPALVMCGAGKKTRVFFGPAAQAVAAAVPGARLVQRRGPGHAKALSAPVIAGTLTGFLTGPDTAARTGGHHA